MVVCDILKVKVRPFVTPFQRLLALCFHEGIYIFLPFLFVRVVWRQLRWLFLLEVFWIQQKLQLLSAAMC